MFSFKEWEKETFLLMIFRKLPFRRENLKNVQMCVKSGWWSSIKIKMSSDKKSFNHLLNFERDLQKAWISMCRLFFPHPPKNSISLSSYSNFMPWHTSYRKSWCQAKPPSTSTSRDKLTSHHINPVVYVMPLWCYTCIEIQNTKSPNTHIQNQNNYYYALHM